MAATVQRAGEYELFASGHEGRRVLVLDGHDWFALPASEDRPVRTDPEYDKADIVRNGEYFLVEVGASEGDRAATHLFLVEAEGFIEIALPEGLPDSAAPEKRASLAEGTEERAVELRGQLAAR